MAQANGYKGEWVFPFNQSDVSDWHIGGNYSAEWKNVPWPLLRVMLFAANSTNDVIPLQSKPFDNTRGKDAMTFTIPSLDISGSHRWYLSLWGNNADGSNTPNSNLDSDVRFFLKAAEDSQPQPKTVTVTSLVGLATSKAESTIIVGTALATGHTKMAATNNKSQTIEIGVGAGLGLGIPLVLVTAGAIFLYKRRSKFRSQAKSDAAHSSYSAQVFEPAQHEGSAPIWKGEPFVVEAGGTRLNEMGTSTLTSTPMHEIGPSDTLDT